MVISYSICFRKLINWEQKWTFVFSWVYQSVTFGLDVSEIHRMV